jgi:hypothetical protein
MANPNTPAHSGTPALTRHSRRFDSWALGRTAASYLVAAIIANPVLPTGARSASQRPSKPGSGSRKLRSAIATESRRKADTVGESSM